MKNRVATASKMNCKQRLGAVYNSNQPRCALRPAVAHQTTPSPVGEGRGGGSKQAALATVYKTNCKQPLAWAPGIAANASPSSLA